MKIEEVVRGNRVGNIQLIVLDVREIRWNHQTGQKGMKLLLPSLRRRSSFIWIIQVNWSIMPVNSLFLDYFQMLHWTQYNAHHIFKILFSSTYIEWTRRKSAHTHTHTNRQLFSYILFLAKFISVSEQYKETMRTKTTIIIEYGSSYFFLYAFDWQINGFVNDVTSIQTLQLPFQLRLRVKYYGITSIINFVWKLSCQLTANFPPRTKTIPWRKKKPNSYYWFCKADIFNFSSECLVYCVLVQTAASRKTATDKYTEKDRHSHNNMRNKCEWLINWMKLRKVYATSADNNKREKIDAFILNPPKSLHTHFNYIVWIP